MTERKQPAMLFYVGDWKKDPTVSLCSPATRGIWVDFLCAMHESNRSGVITGNREQLARVGRCSAVELDQALCELSTSNAASITERNRVITIINRRMKREFDLRGVKSRAGKEGMKKRWHNKTITSLENENVISFSIKEVEDECWKQGISGEAEKIFATYDKRGWKDGAGVPITTLSSCVMNWRLNIPKYQSKKPPTPEPEKGIDGLTPRERYLKEAKGKK